MSTTRREIDPTSSSSLSANLPTINKHMGSPTDVYNYAINDNSYYPKASGSGDGPSFNKRSITSIDGTFGNFNNGNIDDSKKIKMVNFSDLLIKAENNKQTIYPFTVLVLAAIPVLLILCTSAVGFYTKTLVIIIYLLMITLTVYLFKK